MPTDRVQPECGAPRRLFSRPGRTWLAAVHVLVVVGAVGLIVSAAVNGCRPVPLDEEDARPFAGTTVRVAAPPGPPSELIQRHGRAWAERVGATIEIVAAGAPDADLHVLAASAVPALAAPDRLAPLAVDRLDEPGFEANNLLRNYRGKLMVWGSRSFAVPIAGEGLVLVYRKDLFADPNHQQAFAAKYPERSLRPTGPATWQELADAAEYFTAALGRPSLTPLPSDDAALDRLVHSAAVPFVRRAMSQKEFEAAKGLDAVNDVFAYHWDIKTGQPRIAGPGFVAAVELLQRLQTCRPKEPSTEPANSFRDGTAVAMLATLAEVATFQTEGSAVRDRVGIARPPASSRTFDRTGNELKQLDPNGNWVPYLGAGGWMGAVSAASPHKPAAMDLLFDLAGPKTSLEILFDATWGGGPTRRAHLDPANRAGWAAYRFRSPEDTQRMVAVLDQEANPSAINAVFALRTPDATEYRAALLAEVRTALAGRKAAEALKSAADEWQRLSKGRNHIAEYRTSLGLQN